MLRPSTSYFRLGLIGHPLSQSLSPKIHAAALKACGLQGDYSLFPVPPGDKQGLKGLLARLRSGEIHGLNVTIPHKQTVIEFMDELTPTAKPIGAVNTIYVKEDKLIGDNTDAPGFLTDLKKFLTTETQSHGDLNALVLGAGGSARAVVYALLNNNWNVTLATRRIKQAEQVAQSFTNFQLSITAFTDLPLSTSHLIVNTTPLGMHPNIDQSPLPENVMLPSNGIVYDLVYNPRETKLVRDARSKGLLATTGLGMLIEQAALSFELWTGFNPPRDVLYASVVE
jgi:shikimate dehydrogenase